MFFRFVCGSTGLFESVADDCPQGDSRRQWKPQGSWLKKVGPRYPEALSFWTDEGLNRYFESGLHFWHLSVARSKVDVLVTESLANIVYRDENQVLAMPPQQSLVRMTNDELIAGHYPDRLQQKVVAYVTRVHEEKNEVLVFKHPTGPATFQVPAGMVDEGETPEQAVIRELHEEAGIDDVQSCLLISRYSFFNPRVRIFQSRSVYHIQTASTLPERWDHTVSGEGDDGGLVFSYRWVPTRDAGAILQGQGAQVTLL